MSKAQIEVNNDQMFYLREQFLRKPTVYSNEFEARKEDCPQCRRKMDVLCVPHKYRFSISSPRKIRFDSSGIFPFSACQECRLIFLDEEAFSTYVNNKFRFQDFLSEIS
jgi:hypothetical protein